MPYPAKTDAHTILLAAIEQIEQHGADLLSMRGLAEMLDLSPRALYRYYPDRAHLEAAIAEEGFRRLQTTLQEAARHRTGRDAVQAVAYAYRAFALKHPTLYDLLLRQHQLTPGLVEAEESTWTFVVGTVEQVAGTHDAPSVAIALWSFLHGFVQLDRANILGDRKPRSGFDLGLQAFLDGLPAQNNHAI
jgi:AcrR family transcriptional regulator